MAITIHYQMPQGLFPIEEIPPSEVCQPMIDRAEGIARRVLDQLQIPHGCNDWTSGYRRQDATTTTVWSTKCWAPPRAANP